MLLLRDPVCIMMYLRLVVRAFQIKQMVWRRKLRHGIDVARANGRTGARLQIVMCSVKRMSPLQPRCCIYLISYRKCLLRSGKQSGETEADPEVRESWMPSLPVNFKDESRSGVMYHSESIIVTAFRAVQILTRELLVLGEKGK